MNYRKRTQRRRTQRRRTQKRRTQKRRTQKRRTQKRRTQRRRGARRRNQAGGSQKWGGTDEDMIKAAQSAGVRGDFIKEARDADDLQAALRALIEKAVPEGWVVKYSQTKEPGRPYYMRVDDNSTTFHRHPPGYIQWEPPSQTERSIPRIDVQSQYPSGLGAGQTLNPPAGSLYNNPEGRMDTISDPGDPRNVGRAWNQECLDECEEVTGYTRWKSNKKKCIADCEVYPDV